MGGLDQLALAGLFSLTDPRRTARFANARQVAARAWTPPAMSASVEAPYQG